jgi:hypothetical protein
MRRLRSMNYAATELDVVLGPLTEVDAATVAVHVVPERQSPMAHSQAQADISFPARAW